MIWKRTVASQWPMQNLKEPAVHNLKAIDNLGIEHIFRAIVKIEYSQDIKLI